LSEAALVVGGPDAQYAGFDRLGRSAPVFTYLPVPWKPAPDTDPDVDAVQLERYRQMSPAEKVRRVVDLTQLAGTLALAGLRTRHPTASETELLLRLAVIRLGREMVSRAYGWRAPDGP
jgi:hypothetical protein